MSDLSSNSTAASTVASSSTAIGSAEAFHAATASPAGSEELLQLHKMSRTAGLGDSSYVAVNPVAVMSVLFGLLSGIVIFSSLLLVVPVVAIVLAVISMAQVRNSNGTQTGRALAIIGIVLAIGISAALGSKQVMQIYTTRADEAAVAKTLRDFGQAVAETKYDDAYSMISDRLAGDLSRKTFGERLDTLQNSPVFGKIKSMNWNGLASFDIDSRTSQSVVATVAIVTLQSGTEDREDTRLSKSGNTWKIDAMPRVFPPPPPPEVLDSVKSPSRK